ncbi:GTPase HflX [bacterium]|nr:GTPase HflX [bacterium]
MKQSGYEVETSREVTRERAVLVGVIGSTTPEWVVEDHLDELRALADTAGADEVGRVTQRRMKLDPATMIGRGKVNDIKRLLKEKDARLTIFDDDLTPAQVRNLEKELPGKVMDRSGLILDIFALRARTREARVQVELAQLEYYYPRLTRMWSHLRGSQGGIGFRGPGETQLEVDRRIVQDRIGKLKKQLEKIARQRDTRRGARRELPTVALIGYTNAGKSTLLNALTGRHDAYVEDRLFATLDPKVRRFEVTPGHPILAIDTVGFIRKLPHHLVASFRSTLEEAREADILCQVIDLSHPLFEDHIKQTDGVLKDMGMEREERLLVFNKIDNLENPQVMRRMQEAYPDALFLSAARGLRVWDLRERLDAELYQGTGRAHVRLHPDDMAALQKRFPLLQLQTKTWKEGAVHTLVSGPKTMLQQALQELSLEVIPKD